MKYKVMCYECGNIDRFTIKEMRDLHNCQRCYEEHDTICEELANSILENEKQNKRYREAIDTVKKYANDCIDVEVEMNPYLVIDDIKALESDLDE